MTSTGSTQAAATNAAASFPFSPDAATKKQPNAADAFGNLLIATIGDAPQAKNTTETATASDGQSPAPVADAWFTTLTIDFASLNAALDQEEGTVDADAIDVAPQDAAEDCEDDEVSAVETFGLPIVAAVDVPLKPVLVDAAAPDAQGEPAVDAGVINAAADASTPDANAAIGGQGSADQRDARVTTVKANDAPVAQPAVTDVRDTAAPADTTAAESANTAPAQETNQPTQAAGKTQSPAVQGRPAHSDAHAIAQAEVQSAAAQTTAVTDNATNASETASTAQPAVAAATVAQSENAQSSTDMPRTGRARNALAAKFAEMANLGQNPQASAAAARAFADSSGAGSQDASARNAFGGFLRQGSPVAAAPNTTAAPAFAVNPQVNLQAVAATGEVVAAQPTPGAVPDAENVGRLIQTMRVQVQQGVQEATVRLNPEHFGEVTISLKVERGAVSAVIHTDTPAVQEWLQSQEDKLRSGLSDQGLHLERYQVQRDGSRREAQQQQQQQQTPRHRQSRSNNARFEISV